MSVTTTCDGCCPAVARLRVSARETLGAATWCYRHVEIDEEENLHYYMRRTDRSYFCHKPFSAPTGGEWCLSYESIQWIPGDLQLQGMNNYKPCELLASSGGAIEQEVTDTSGCPPVGHGSSSGCGDLPGDAGTVYSEEEMPPSAGAILAVAITDAEESEPSETVGEWGNVVLTGDPDSPSGGPLSAVGGELDASPTGASAVVREFKVENDGPAPVVLRFELVTKRVEDDEELDRSERFYDIPPGGSTGWIDLAPATPSDYDAVYAVLENQTLELA